MAATRPAAPGSGRRRILTAVIVLVTFSLLYWILRDTSFSDILAHLKRARPAPLLAAVILATSTFGIRAIRWRILLRRSDGGPLPWSALWHATAMGFMANNTLPLRLGEVVRSYAASRLGGVPLAAALSSIAVERALDLLTLVGLLGLALLRAGLPGETMVMGNRLDLLAIRAGILCAVIFVGALGVVLFPLAAERMVRRFVPVPRLADQVVHLIEALRAGLQVLRRPKQLLAAGGWSIGCWLVNGASFYVAFAAFGIQVDFAGALLIQTMIAFGVAAPQAPGYFGVFELVVAAALGLFGIPASLAVAYGATYHVTTFLPIVLLGLWSLARTGLRVRDAKAVTG